MQGVAKGHRRNWFYSYDIIFDLDVSHQATLVYIYLCRCADNDSQSYPSIATIAKKCKIGVTATKKAIAELIEKKLIKRESRYRENGSQASNLYIVFEKPYEDKEVSKDDKEESTNTDRIKKSSETIVNIGGQNTTPGQYATPGQNTTPPRSVCDPLEGLPNRRTIYNNNIQSVCHITSNTRKNLKAEKKEKQTDGQTEILKKQLEQVKRNCELHIFQDKDKRRILENALELMFFSKQLKVQNSIIPGDKVRSRMLAELNGAILLYAWDKAKQAAAETKIKNTTQYLCACIYNAMSEYFSDLEFDQYICSLEALEESEC